MERKNIEAIIKKFADSGWELISKPSKLWLEGKGNAADLIEAIQQADKECGSCGCEYDDLYKTILANKNML